MTQRMIEIKLTFEELEAVLRLVDYEIDIASYLKESEPEFEKGFKFLEKLKGKILKHGNK